MSFTNYNDIYDICCVMAGLADEELPKENVPKHVNNERLWEKETKEIVPAKEKELALV